MILHRDETANLGSVTATAVTRISPPHGPSSPDRATGPKKMSATALRTPHPFVGADERLRLTIPIQMGPARRRTLRSAAQNRDLDHPHVMRFRTHPMPASHSIFTAITCPTTRSRTALTSRARESTHNRGTHGSAGSRHIGPLEHQLFCLRTWLHPDGDSLTTRAFLRSAQAGTAKSPRFHKRSRHGQGPVSDEHTPEIASDQVFLGADEENRTPVFSLGIGQNDFASCLVEARLAWSAHVLGSLGVARCCAEHVAVSLPSRHVLGTVRAPCFNQN